MKTFKHLLLTSTLLIFTACGTQTQVDQDKVFDLWEYMTSSSNYEVKYDVYENNIKVDSYIELHHQFGDEYERVSDSGKSTLYLNPQSILMHEISGDIDIQRYVNLGDRDIFQSPLLKECRFKKFYENYHTKNLNYYNVLQITCTTNSNLYQEFYYGYNEGIVSYYEKNNLIEKEYVKVSEERIFN